MLLRLLISIIRATAVPKKKAQAGPKQRKNLDQRPKPYGGARSYGPRSGQYLLVGIDRRYGSGDPPWNLKRAGKLRKLYFLFFFI